MRINLNLAQEIQRFKEYVIIVEGKKDVAALHNLEFEKVYPIHITGIPLLERIRHLSGKINKHEKVCILTDFDKKGKQLYFILKKEFRELGVKLDSSLRSLLLKTRVSHIEGLDSYINKLENN